MRVLVTGATGFTGGHLARALVRRGYTVRALVRPGAAGAVMEPGALGAVVQPGAPGAVIQHDARTRGLTESGVTVVAGDLGDRASLDRATRDVDLVYNVAALYREAGLPEETYRAINAGAVRTLIDAAARNGVRRVVHCSTVGVHGDVERPPASEDAPFRPGDVYQWSKLEGEQVARKASAETGVEVVIVRPTGIYGPGDRRLLKLFRGVARRRFVILGSGRIYYHLTYIDDLVEGFRLCGEVPAAAGRTYILAGAEVTTLEELVARIASAAGVQPISWHLPVWPVWLAGAICEGVCAPLKISPPLYRRRVDFFTKSRAFDITRARTELGFAPAVGLTDGISRTLDWYRREGWI